MDEIFFVLFVKIERVCEGIAKSPTYPRKDDTALQENCDPQECLYEGVV
jgi:hypothetical protein